MADYRECASQMRPLAVSIIDRLKERECAVRLEVIQQDADGLAL